MNAVKCSEIHNNGSEDRQCPGHLQRAAQGHGDTGQLTERRNHVLKNQLPSSEGKNVLQLRLQQRRTREQLADQGIMPHPASDGSSLEAQLRLKRARLAEDLNEKLALRPGPLELVQKKIIPLDSADTMTVNHGKFPKQDDSYAFEEDSSSESLSPEQHHSDESQGSACPSSEAVGSTPSSSSSPALTSPRQGGAARDPPDQSQDEGLSGANNSQATPPIPVPAIVKSKTSDKNRHKKPKDVKPKVKKLKYHQYIPPDQKAEKSPPPMDSAYARLLQQQQLFLQLQILSQQKHSHTHPQTQQSQPHAHTPQTQAQAQQRQPAFSYQPHPPAQTQKGSSEQIPACSSSGPSSTANSNSSSPVKNTYPNPSNISPVKPGPLPANLDDLKVSELRQHLRIRGLPVSGTKTALIERLRPFKDSNASSSPSGSSDITTVTFPVTPTGSLSSYQSPSSSSVLSQGGYYPYPSTSSTPPISPASSELSLSGSLPDSFSDVPMSSPTQFALQPSPAQLSMEDGLGGGNQGGGGQRAGEGGGMDGLEAEKDKMLVEKQKVIEELTWKLHQEQRQVEELKMQLHKRKRCYGATQDPPPSHPSMHHQQTPAMMGQHFFGVTIKQEPMSLSSSCPLSSPKQLKSPPGSCMEEMGHCNTSVSNLGGPSGPQCMDTTPSSGSPSTMSAFLSPQCSPQDSPNGKPSSSPQPSSPNNPYLLSPPLGRDGCGHPHTPGNNRARNMPIQQKSGAQPVNCSYTSDQRGLQGVFPNSADCGLSHGGSAKADSQNMQPKISVLPSPRHVGQKSQVSPPAFSSSDSDASDLRQPPCYEDAVKQQLTRSQQMDELLDVLIESGGCPGLLIPRFHRHYEHLYPSQPPYDHSANHITESHLETLLGSPVGRGGEAALLKMATEDRGLEDEGTREGEGYGSPHNHHRHPHHPPQDKLLANRDQMDTPLSPISTKASTFPEVQGMVSMTFSETPWETMEWLDLMPPSSATAFSVAPPSGPSIFNTEFLDVTDINLNSAMDLHLEHW
ncbi:myocardin isoform X2 [Toxotes jaculatrix]|uniref:myocardin isoform X2 n=1 Tax=Toxotes jaculatrix TaxID=941984 RepID=UPI001B3AA89C|nr:myocardin isoform X2 [Toxotes jaculatrix]